MGAFLYDAAEAERKIKQKLDSHEWWMIVAATESGNDVAEQIEREFYLNGEAAEDFWIFLANRPCSSTMFLALFLAHKRWMSPAQLAGLFRKNLEDHGFRVPDGFTLSEKNDVIITPDMPREVLIWLGEKFGGRTAK